MPRSDAQSLDHSTPTTRGAPTVDPPVSTGRGVSLDRAPPPPATTTQDSPSMSDWLLKHVAGTVDTARDLGQRTINEAYAPWGQIGNDVASTFREGQWLGADQPLLAKARGITTDQQRQQDSDAYSRLGFLGMPVTGLGYAAGGGALGIGEKIGAAAFKPLLDFARPTIARYGANIAGSVGENSIANYASTLFHGGNLSDQASNFIHGLPWGVAAGLPGGGRAETPIKSPVQALTAKERSIYSDMDNIKYKGSDASQALQKVTDTIVDKEGQGALDLAKSTNAQIDKLIKPADDVELTGQDAMNHVLSQKGTLSPDDYKAALNDVVKTGKVTIPGDSEVSAADVQRLQQRLDSISGSPSAANEDRRFARQYSDGLDWLHESAEPTSDHAAGDAADILDRGAPITQQRKNAQMLDDWRRQADIAKNPSYPATAAKDELINNPQFYAGRDPTQPGGYNANDPRTQALQSVADSDPGSSSAGYQAVKHTVMPGAHAVAGELLGQSFGHPTAGTAAGLGVYAGLLPLYSRLADTAGAAKTQLSYEGAYPTMTGGAAAPGSGAPSKGMLQEAIRNIIFGNTAAGVPMYSSNQNSQ